MCRRKKREEKLNEIPFVAPEGAIKHSGDEARVAASGRGPPKTTRMKMKQIPGEVWSFKKKSQFTMQSSSSACGDRGWRSHRPNWHTPLDGGSR